MNTTIQRTGMHIGYIINVMVKYESVLHVYTHAVTLHGTYMYTCMYVYTYMIVHVCVYMYVRMYMYLYVPL